MSTAATLTPTSQAIRARDIAHLSASTRTLRHQTAIWAMQAGESLGFDALTIILAAKEELDGDPTHWNEDDVWHLWWVDLMRWCVRRQLTPPADIAATFATLLHFLHSGPGLASGSCALPDLLSALDGAGGTMRTLPATGTPLP